MGIKATPTSGKSVHPDQGMARAGKLAEHHRWLAQLIPTSMKLSTTPGSSSTAGSTASTARSGIGVGRMRNADGQHQ